MAQRPELTGCKLHLQHAYKVPGLPPRLSRPLTGAPLRLDKILRLAQGLTGSKSKS